MLREVLLDQQNPSALAWGGFQDYKINVLGEEGAEGLLVASYGV
jgi:hypothetical protein